MKFCFPKILWPRPGITEHVISTVWTSIHCHVRQIDLANAIAFTHSKVLLKIIVYLVTTCLSRTVWSWWSKSVSKLSCFAQIVFSGGNFTWRFFLFFCFRNSNPLVKLKLFLNETANQKLKFVLFWERLFPIVRWVNKLMFRFSCY